MKTQHVILTLVLLVLSGGAFQELAAQQRHRHYNPFHEAPEGVILPPLNPEGATLHTRMLGDGVYALVSDKPPVDNAGFVVGQKGVLVIDAHINPAMARQIQEAVRAVTDKPILYLVNTNFHGDHTFGNATFPASTTIIAHYATAEIMMDFEDEWQLQLANMGGDAAVLEGIKPRLPDVTFEDYLRIDLGDKVVEVYHFGSGNTPGDAVVYVPDTRTAWTGNLVLGTGLMPPIFEGRTEQYLQSISRFAATIQPTVVVPGHGGLTDSRQFGRYTGYLNALIGDVRRAVSEGKTLEQTLAALPLGTGWLPPSDSPLAGFGPFLEGLHRLNVQQTYLDYTTRRPRVALSQTW